MLDDRLRKKRRNDPGDGGSDGLLDLRKPGPNRGFELRIFVEMELLPLRLRLLPRSGELNRVAVRSLDASFRKAFLAAARISLGEFGRHVLGLDQLCCRRRLPRRGLERNRLWRPWRAPRSVFTLRFAGAAHVRCAIEHRLRIGPPILRARQASGAKRRALPPRRGLLACRAPETIKIVGDREGFHPFAP